MVMRCAFSARREQILISQEGDRLGLLGLSCLGGNGMGCCTLGSRPPSFGDMLIEKLAPALASGSLS